MVKKPISGDEEQRRANVRASRFQSGLPPEPDQETEPKREPEPAEGERAPREEDVA